MKWEIRAKYDVPFPDFGRNNTLNSVWALGTRLKLRNSTAPRNPPLKLSPQNDDQLILEVIFRRALTTVSIRLWKRISALP